MARIQKSASTLEIQPMENVVSTVKYLSIYLR